MTDKEQIMIDGVDVSECEYSSATPSSILCYMRGNKCNDNPNCYFKQLARKMAECGERKQDAENWAYKAGLATGKASRYLKALEEIEGIIKKGDCVDCREHYYNQHCEDCDKGDILDIISKAKEGD